MSKKFHLNTIILFLALTAMILSACQPPVSLAFEDVCRVENDGQNVTTQGYFSLGASVYCSDTMGEYRCGLNFNDPSGSTDIFSVDVMVGNRKNQMQDIESGFSEDDLVIKTSSGALIGAGEEVLITGRMLVTETVCVMEVEKIEIQTE